MVTHTFSPRTQEVEAALSTYGAPRQPELHRQTQSEEKAKLRAGLYLSRNCFQACREAPSLGLLFLRPSPFTLLLCSPVYFTELSWEVCPSVCQSKEDNNQKSQGMGRGCRQLHHKPGKKEPSLGWLLLLSTWVFLEFSSCLSARYCLLSIA